VPLCGIEAMADIDTIETVATSYFGRMSKMKVLICIGDKVTILLSRKSLGFLESSAGSEFSTTFHFNLSSLSTLRLAPRVTSSTEVMVKALNSLSSWTVTSRESSESSSASNWKLFQVILRARFSLLFYPSYKPKHSDFIFYV
jgi:hypothetical protein